ncbi:MAG: CvpA family protein [Planctomycetota bacterium]
MILNLIILAFVLGMAVMWATYGLFSAFLHLLVVVVSGALAFAFWELWVYKLLMGFVPLYAWGVGLVAPFAVMVIVFRVLLDTYIKGNMQFPRLADQILGGACGACSGILTAGVAVIGIGFLPLPPVIVGWQPYEVDSIGDVVPRDGGKLWIGVDRMAAGFFNKLSNGAFHPASGTPLAGQLPDVDKQAGVSRLAKFYDANQSVVATPGTVSATATTTFAGEAIPGVDAVINDYIAGELKTTGSPGVGRLVTVQTEWTKGDGGATYDTDNVLRVPPTQIRLHVIADGEGQLLAPIAFGKKNADGVAQFFQVNNNQIIASSTFDPEQITWFFAAPAGAQPNFLLVRNTRIGLPALTDDGEGQSLAPLIGQLYDPNNTAVAANTASTQPTGEGAVTNDPVGYTTHKAYEIQQSNFLPSKVSKNKAQAFSYTDDGEITGGSGILGKGGGGQGNSVDRFTLSPALRPIRLQIGPHTPPPGGQAVGNQQEVYLTDSRGGKHYPYAYALMMTDGRQKARVEPANEFRNNTDLPINEIRGDEKLYIYFRVSPGVTIRAYHIGPATQQLDFKVGS